jgi:hypothetical protein
VRRAALAALTAAALAAAPAAEAAIKTKHVGWGPLSSKKAAKKVKRSNWEPRPRNRAANRRVPKRRLLAAWRARSEMPYARFVNGRFRGTIDEIIQWAARKWGLDPELLRAVAMVESWWRMKTVGDSFGLFQVRRPYHCWDACHIARRFTAFNADYYGGITGSEDARERIAAAVTEYHRRFSGRLGMRAIWTSSASDPELAAQNLNDSRANGRAIAVALRDVSDLPAPELDRRAFLVAQLTGAAVSMAALTGDPEGDELIQSFARIAADALVPSS